jgi:hypothetical protein
MHRDQPLITVDLRGGRGAQVPWNPRQRVSEPALLARLVRPATSVEGLARLEP